MPRRCQAFVGAQFKVRPGAFLKLEPGIQSRLLTRLAIREQRFILTENSTPEKPAHGRIPAGKSPLILLVGDRPAPSAPDSPQFVYTPFGALCHSSLWINLQLEAGGIPEERLAWINSADRLGCPHNPQLLHYPWKKIIALGGAASGWLAGHEVHHQRVHHPASWKRFQAGAEYPLIAALQALTQD